MYRAGGLIADFGRLKTVPLRQGRSVLSTSVFCAKLRAQGTPSSGLRRCAGCALHEPVYQALIGCWATCIRAFQGQSPGLPSHSFAVVSLANDE